VGALWENITSKGSDCDVDILKSVDLDYKELEITRGFLVHLAMNFEMLTHHLKGFHLALALHLPG
jgi:hypothetical protein